MIMTECQIWDAFNTKKPIYLDAKWLKNAYSLDLSIELRFTIGERLGLLGDKGWQGIKLLIDAYSPQPELIYAAGLCHQREAFDFLLKLLRENSRSEIKITIVRALACWGAIIPIAEIRKILREDSIHMRLAGLKLLGFKSYLLNASELLELVEGLLDDFREEVIIQIIRILQRRDEEEVIKCISKIASNGTDKTVETALIALGCIGNDKSAFALSTLYRDLNNQHHREIARKQISHQYINS